MASVLELQGEFHSSRLMEYLSQLAVTDTPVSHKNFSERLGRWVDFGNSIRLSELHGKVAKQPFEASALNSIESAKNEILTTRESIVQSVLSSFALDPEARIRAPVSCPDTALNELAKYEPYHRFYAAHQRDFEAKLQLLQMGVRDAVATVSADLAKLAALDEGLREIFVLQTRQQLAVIPKLLESRFVHLRKSFASNSEQASHELTVAEADAKILQTWIEPDAWLGQFLNDMRGSLLAELELRLLPILGLIEAVDEQVGKTQ